MWNKPAILNLLANALFACVACACVWTLATFIVRMPAFALRTVYIDTMPTHVTRAEIEQAVRASVDGNFFTLNLEHLRAGFEHIPWVRVASVRRIWPASVEVDLEEHVPLARWNSGELVNTYGETFIATDDDANVLPVFSGPPGSAQDVMREYEALRVALAALHETPQKVALSERRAWRVTLASGLVIELGREDTDARLARFIAAWPRVLERYGQQYAQAPQGARPDRVDLRYPNGFAVHTAGQS